MRADASEDLGALGRFQSQVPPAPSAALLESVRAMKPVRTRVPWHTLVLIGAAACVYPLYIFLLYPLRLDLRALPLAWVVGVGLLWLAGFLVPLSFALLPPRGQVLPSSRRAGWAAFLAASTLVLCGLLFTIDAPGVTILPRTPWDSFFKFWWGCVRFGLKVTVPTLILAGFAMRRFALVKPWRLGAAVGAAGGAIAGLTLHGLCPVGGALHVGLSHGGGVVIGALLGALWLPVVTGLTRPRPPGTAAER